MHPLDYTIVAAYLVGLLGMGFYLARKASQSADDYFLGGRKMPWWALGASGMSSNLDAAGTMTIVTLIYLFGLHGFFIEMRGGVVLPIAVFLAFMGKWHQRSQVMTTAEWMELRFGAGWEGKLARLLAALTYLIITVGMVVFFIAAAGKFLAVFLPFEPATCSVAMAIIALVYTMVSGLYGVVWTDVFQAFLIGAAAIYVSLRAWLLVDPELLAAWPGADYNTVFPRLGSAVGDYEIFGLFLLGWLGKGLMEGLGGSGGSAYMAQRFYAAPDERACSRIAMLWAVLFAFRWPMVLGFAVLAIHLGIGQDDPERILPLVLQSEFFPAGIRGIVVAAIFAASMSTFDSTINAGASYVVKDVFQLAKPQASQRAQVIAGYVASIGIVAAGLVLALLTVESVVDVWVTIVIQLFPAFLVPFTLRWYWSRFNGLGFALGIVFGFGASFSLVFVDLGLNELQILLSVMGVSAIGCLLGTFLSSPTSRVVQENFYRQIRPFGLWPRAWKKDDTREHRRDMTRLIAALVWQIATFLLPMTFVLKLYPSFTGLFVLWLALLVYLLRTEATPANDN
ncbi:sodium:solute symporter family transporter [Cerasicoccus fimbriatus]|uniref:sodium:solute symporter family transporter n=1 Tax=Cerasicoccus fimbriatus TaxID=3014554 RepID=UPI0022B4383C|nr:hypothetical protein [Cerasicoccus sp. TK19100]